MYIEVCYNGNTCESVKASEDNEIEELACSIASDPSLLVSVVMPTEYGFCVLGKEACQRAVFHIIK